VKIRDQFHQEQQADHTRTLASFIQHQWPSLGRELVALEREAVDLSASDQQFQVEQERLRQSILAQVYQQEGQYSRTTRYLAFFLVKYGRGGVIVGNPSHFGKKGTRQILPYTGLEGYYAGSEHTAERAGMAPDDILTEEAQMGAHLLKTLKKHAGEQDCWPELTHLLRTLEGKEQKREAMQTIQTLWAMTTGQLRSRVYHNPEFKQTITERIEQAELMLGQISTHTEEERRVHEDRQKEYERMKGTYESMNEREKAQERTERTRRERIRAERLEAFQGFREETYQLLEASGKGRYDIGIQDRSWDTATISETIVLPTIPSRETYPSVQVHWTPEQLDGYLFLARLGEIGADPLVRSKLVQSIIHSFRLSFS
jgi:hypothetical protein